MSNETNLPSSDDADPDKESTPAGTAGELEEWAGETDATTDDPEAPADS
jgi:hypothetical protein